MPPGTPPGTLAVDPAAPKPTVRVFAFGPDAYVEKMISKAAEIPVLRGSHPVLWVDVDGLGDEAVLRELSAMFALHPLAMEDVVNIHQRAKVDQFGEHLFIVTRMVEWRDRLQTEQVSMFLGQGFVLTFQERPGGDVLEPVRDRIRNNRGRVRRQGADYLAYALLDAVVDSYFPVLERMGERIEVMEDEVVMRPERGLVTTIHDLRHDMVAVRRCIWPQREAINSLLRIESPMITPETRLYLRDAYDHTVQIIDILETYRELGAGLMEVYLSSLSNRLNEVMKVLTIIATIFMPLSFIAGVWGMNFHTEQSPWNMPELSWYYGYPMALGVMTLTALGLLMWFRRRGWLGGSASRQ